MAGHCPQFPTPGGNPGGYVTNSGEQPLEETHYYDGAYTNQASLQSPNQFHNTSPPITTPRVHGYHPSQGQPAGSLQFGWGPQYSRQRGFSDQLVDNTGLGPSRPPRSQRSPSIVSNNSNYTFRSLNTELHNKYFMRPNEQGFFKTGRKVFACLWTETLGETTNDRDNPKYTPIKFNQRAFSEIQRFVVICPNFMQRFSICCPINTYGSKGTTKNPDPDSHYQHAIIYTGESEPRKLEKEPEFTKLPIKMEPFSPRDRLNPESRLNFGKPTTVQHNLRVKQIGDVTPQHLEYIFQYFAEEQEAMLAKAKCQVQASLQREALGFHSPFPDLASLSLSSETGIADAPSGVEAFAGIQDTAPGQTLAPSGYASISTASPLESGDPESHLTGMLEHTSNPAFYQTTYVSNDIGSEQAEQYYEQRPRGSTVPQPSSRREVRPNQRTKSDMTGEKSREFREQAKSKGGRKNR